MPSLGGYRVFRSLLVDQDRLLDPAGALTATLRQSAYRGPSIIHPHCANVEKIQGRQGDAPRL